MKIAADVAFLGPLGMADVSRMEFTPGVHGVDVSQTHCQHRQLGFTAFGRFVSVLQPVGAWSLVSGISNGSVTLSLRLNCTPSVTIVTLMGCIKGSAT